MCNDRVASIDNLRVVTTLIEHTHVQSEHICKINCTAHTTLIRADDHHVIAVDLKICLGLEQILDELVDRLNRLESL